MQKSVAFDDTKELENLIIQYLGLHVHVVQFPNAGTKTTKRKFQWQHPLNLHNIDK